MLFTVPKEVPFFNLVNRKYKIVSVLNLNSFSSDIKAKQHSIFVNIIRADETDGDRDTFGILLKEILLDVLSNKSLIKSQ